MRRLSADAIDEMIQENRAFAMYRIAGEKYIRFVPPEQAELSFLSSISELNGEKGFVIAPFHVSDKTPLGLIRGNEELALLEDEEVEETQEDPVQEKTGVSDQYAAVFDRFMAPLHNGTLKKLVLSRSKSYLKTEGFSAARAFYLACNRYIRSYVYLFHTPQTGTWIGSTPEILLSGRRGEWHTVALAGTQPLQGEDFPEKWSDKNHNEQQMVVDYVRQQLQSFHVHPEEKGPYPVRAGRLSHLRTDFYFDMPETDRLGDLLNHLHPTPAVCGMPKEEAFRFIRENEGYDRNYYSGFIGWLDPEGETDLYVNLRCMQVADSSIVLYAGGGLLPLSQLTDEWEETESKMATMGSVLSMTNK